MSKSADGCDCGPRSAWVCPSQRPEGPSSGMCSPGRMGSPFPSLWRGETLTPGPPSSSTHTGHLRTHLRPLALLSPSPPRAPCRPVTSSQARIEPSSRPHCLCVLNRTCFLALPEVLSCLCSTTLPSPAPQADEGLQNRPLEDVPLWHVDYFESHQDPAGSRETSTSLLKNLNWGPCP